LDYNVLHFFQAIMSHPAPFPPTPANVDDKNLKRCPPKPTLRISRGGQGKKYLQDIEY